MTRPLTLVARGALAAVVAVAATSTLLAQEPPKTEVAGASVFRTYCAACHGTEGKGDGPIAASLRKKPADLTTFAARNGGTYDAALVGRIIDGRNPVRDHGGKDMPVWGDAFGNAVGAQGDATVNARVSSLVRYLQTIQAK